MQRESSSLRQHIRQMRVAYLVLGLSLVATAIVHNRVLVNVEAREQGRFERAVREEKATIQQQVPHYVNEMMGVRGLFAANASVSADQWQKYVGSVEIPRLYPGISTLGYLEQV